MKIISPLTENDWQVYYEIRWRLLRAPWRQAKGSERDEMERNAHHVMVKTDAGETIGVGRVHSITPDEWQIRYMAVHEVYRGRGVGAMILKELERHAQSQKASRIVLNARESAVGFYLRYNYRVCGDAPVLFGVIKHKRMQKNL